MKNLPRTVLIGAGKVATHLGLRLKQKGVPVLQVVNRSPENGLRLAQLLETDFTENLSETRNDADWYIIAVKDDAILSISQGLSGKIGAGIVTHTSGATSGEILRTNFLRSGIFYPLQTFSIEKKPVWSKIPLCVDAPAENDIVFLEKMARHIGAKPHRVNDEQRAQLHLAAVFANNFTNHCFTIASQMLTEKGLSFSILHPLMEATLEKALSNAPIKMQTGPAVRKDYATIQRHLAMLEKDGLLHEIYKKMSESILSSIS